MSRNKILTTKKLCPGNFGEVFFTILSYINVNPSLLLKLTSSYTEDEPTKESDLKHTLGVCFPLKLLVWQSYLIGNDE